MKRALIIGAIFFAIDQLSKWLIVYVLDLPNIYRLDVFPPFLVFKMAWNEGINFGLFSDSGHIMRWILTALAVGVSGYLLYWSRQFSGWIAAIFIGMVIGGALGNAFDRILYGAVVDFLNMSCCGFNNPYVFNIADVFVFVGIFGIILFSERFKKRA